MAEGERSEREEGQIKYRNTIQSKEQSSVTVVSSLKRQTIADSEGRTAEFWECSNMRPWSRSLQHIDNDSLMVTKRKYPTIQSEKAQTDSGQKECASA